MGTIIANVLTLLVVALLSMVVAYLLLLWRLSHMLGESLTDGCDWLIESGGVGEDYRCNYQATKREQTWRVRQWSKRVTATVVMSLFSVGLILDQIDVLLYVVALFGARLWVVALYLAVCFGVLATLIYFEISNRNARAYVMLAMLDTGVENVVLTRPMTGEVEEDVWRIGSHLLDDDTDYFGGHIAKLAKPDTICMVIAVAGRRFVQDCAILAD